MSDRLIERLKDPELYVDAVDEAIDRINALQAEVERMREALVRIQDNPCSGHYGPCGAADMSVYIADEALTDQP